MVTWALQSAEPKRDVDWFNHFCTDDCRVFLYFRIRHTFTPQNCRFPWGTRGCWTNQSLQPKPHPRLTSLSSGILFHPAVWPQQTWATIGGCPFWGRGAVSPSNSVAGVEAYLYAKFHLDPSNRLANGHNTPTFHPDRQDHSPIKFTQVMKIYTEHSSQTLCTAGNFAMCISF